MAMTLELSDEQQAVLADVLKHVLGDLSYEISDTDISSFKEQLKEKRAEIEAIANQLT